MANLRDKLESCRGRRDHEWTLLSQRLGALMTSQAFLIGACAIVYRTERGPDNSAVIMVLASVALAICFVSSIVIAINCRVIRDWHKFVRRLLESDTDGELDGYWMPRRTNDIKHVLTADVFSLFLPLMFSFIWIMALVYVGRWPEVPQLPSLIWPQNSKIFPAVAVVYTVWLTIIGLIYALTSEFRLNGTLKGEYRR